MNYLVKKSCSVFIILSLLSSFGFAAGKGGHAVGGGLLLSSPPQDNLDSVIDGINATNNVAVGKFGSAYELFIHYSYRFSGSIFGLHIRPSYFTASADGAGREFKLNGFTFYPMLRLYPLENSFIKFFMQAGVGYGHLLGEASDSAGSVEFSGGSFGTVAGLGAEFCFTASHCMVLEGNLRYNPITRNIVSDRSGDPSGLGFSQYDKTQELEYANADVQTTMSGLQGGLSYTYSF